MILTLQSFWQEFFRKMYGYSAIEQNYRLRTILKFKSGPVSSKMRNSSRHYRKMVTHTHVNILRPRSSADKKIRQINAVHTFFSLFLYLHTISTYYLSMYLHSLFRYLLTAVACCIKSFKTLFWREKFWRINFKNMHAWITRYFDEKMLNHVWFCVYIFWTENLTLKTYHILTKKNVESCLLKKNLHEFLFCSNFN